jgi:glycosyltransferase involved in cell wall biosynthesis
MVRRPTQRSGARRSAVIVFTLKYPFDRGEEFLDGELPYLASEFDEVIVVPTRQVAGEAQTRALPEGVRLVAPETIALRRIAALAKVARHPLMAVRTLVRSLRWSSGRSTLAEDLQFDLLSSQVALAVKGRLRMLLRDIPDVVFYGFWLTVPARVALETRRQLRRHRSPAVSRANGFDLYAERAARGYHPQRHLVLKSLDRVFPASSAAEQYLREKYPEYLSKYRVERIGTTSPINPGNARRIPIRVVSCSYVAPVKRIPMLIDGLAELRRRGVDFTWTHLGGGNEIYFQEVAAHAQQRLAPGSFEFRGHMESHVLRRWYAENPATFFAQMSESEGGLAASIQEALAQGLPVIVTNVGGVGILAETELPIFDGLLRADHAPEEFADRVQQLLNVDDQSFERYSRAAMAYWAEHCSVDSLARGFASRLKRLAEDGRSLSR